MFSLDVNITKTVQLPSDITFFKFLKSALLSKNKKKENVYCMSVLLTVSVQRHESDPTNPITEQSGKRENLLSQLFFSGRRNWSECLTN